MKAIQGKYQIILMVTILIVIRFAFGLDSAMLSFILFWQVVATKRIVDGFKFFARTQRRHTTVKGRVVTFHEVLNEMDNDTTYEAVIEFSFPAEKNKYQIIHQTAFLPPDEYNIWIKESNPQDSIVDDQLQSNVINLVPLVLINILLLFVDYFLLKKILNGFVL